MINELILDTEKTLSIAYRLSIHLVHSNINIPVCKNTRELIQNKGFDNPSLQLFLVKKLGN